MSNNNNFVIWKSFMANPVNLPIPRPGAYMIWNMINGKGYIGISENLQNRLTSHARSGSPSKLRNAIKKYRSKSFIIIPLYYMTNYEPELLLRIEVDLIKTFDTIKWGYNVIEACGRVGPYGPLFSAILQNTWNDQRRAKLTEIMKKRWSDPEYRNRAISSMKANPNLRRPRSLDSKARMSISAKNRKPPNVETRSKISKSNTGKIRTAETRSRIAKITKTQWSDNESRAKRIEAINIAFMRPEVKLNQSLGAKRRYEDPAQRAATSKMAAEINARPGMKERKSKASSALIWINNSIINKRLRRDLPLPDGWKLGMKSR